MTKISAVIITLNEEENIARCVVAARKVAEEIVVVDSFSSDRTVEICEELGCHVYQKEWLGYSAQKNWANEKATHEYILSLDADEVLNDELISDINYHKNAGLEGIYSLVRITNYCGTWIKHSGWYPDEKIRLFPKSGTAWKGSFVHETLSFSEEFTVAKLNGDLLHYSYNSYDDHRQRAAKYAKLSAEKMHAEKKSAGIFKPYISAIAKFIGMYFAQLGFLDGKHGLILAWISAQGNFKKYQILISLNTSNDG